MPDRISSQLQWEEVPRGIGTVLQAGVSRPDLPSGTYLPCLCVAVFPNPLPLEEWAKLFMPVWVNIFTDIKVLSDKPSLLKDGTPAREVEVEFSPKFDPSGRSQENPPRLSGLQLMTKKDPIWVTIFMNDDRGKIGQDLRRVVYSLAFQPGREQPVQVPPDVRAFFDMWCVDAMSHDVKTIMEHYSDRFRHSGFTKKVMEQFYRNDPLSPIHKDIISEEATVTVFESRGDKAYVDGFVLEKVKGSANAMKIPMTFQQIIKEHGEWKWFGNQK